MNGRISQKSLWWSHVEEDIEAMATQHEACKITAAMSTQAAHNQCQYPSTPCKRVYINCPWRIQQDRLLGNGGCF